MASNYMYFMRILLIEDEQKIADFIKEVLENDGEQVTYCRSVEEVQKNHYANTHDLIILDLMLPGMGGLDYVRLLRKGRNTIPVIVLSALNQISSKVDLFNAGADDYLTKPFEALELLTRIKSVYRRQVKIDKVEDVKVGELIFHRRQNQVVRGDKVSKLTAKEGDLLMLLIYNCGKVVRNEDILSTVWNTKRGFHSNILQSTVRRLRKKIDEGFEKAYIKNIHGVGYMISED